MKKKAATLKVPVSNRALVQRINRALAKRSEHLHVTRQPREGVHRDWTHLGDYYIVNTYRNFVVARHVNPEVLGRELKVLRPYERLVKQAEEARA